MKAGRLVTFAAARNALVEMEKLASGHWFLAAGDVITEAYGDRLVSIGFVRPMIDDVCMAPHRRRHQ